MTNLADALEFAENPEPRCPCVLLLDTSGSMSGARIRELNDGLLTLKQTLDNDPVAKKRVEVAVVTFDSSVNVIQDFVTVDNFHAPTLTAQGSTSMAAGIQEAINLLDRRKATYKTNGVVYYRPWIFLITDGAPTDTGDIPAATQRLSQAHAGKKLAFFAVGVEGADMNQLRTIAPPENPPKMLKGLAFKELFLWLSASLSSASSQAPNAPPGQTPLPSVAGWTI